MIGGVLSNREKIKQIDEGDDLRQVTPSITVDEEVSEVVRKSQVKPLPLISNYPKPARESTMRNVLNAVNRIQET